MLAISIPSDPLYEGLSIRPVSLPEDLGDLIEIHKKDVFHPMWTMQPTAKFIENLYGPFLHMLDYNIYLISYLKTPLFVLELAPMDNIYHYEDEPNDYFLDIKICIDPSQVEPAILALLAVLQSFFTVCPLVNRVVFPVYYSIPRSLLKIILDKVGFAVPQKQDDPKLPAIYICRKANLNRSPGDYIVQFDQDN